MPKKVGEFTIPALALGKEKTQPIKLSVKRLSEKGAEKSGRLVFLKASLDKKSTYVNSPVIYRLKLFYNQAINSGALYPPEIPGATLKIFSDKKNLVT